jgi:cytochrome c553
LVGAVAVDVVAAPPKRSAPPDWAYGYATPVPAGTPRVQPAAAAPKPATPPRPRPFNPADTVQRTVPGSDRSFTIPEIRNANGPADWFPGDHPPMPDIVAHGRPEANITACSLCHYPNGKGRPENAGVAGLPYSYILNVLQEFKNDQRRSHDPRKANTNNMIGYAKTLTDSEMQAAAAYFSSMKWTPWVKVVESDSVPKTRISGGMFIPLEGPQAGTEPIRGRIIEVPVNAEATETLRNPRSGFIAYAPRGSIRRGANIAARAQCVLCHGPNLEGLGPVPGIAGRSPSYLVRQMYDMQQGDRHGEWTELMKPIMKPLTTDQIRDVAAYVASRTP